MNFLEQIWLIPLFPLLGAALMFFFGRRLDPQPRSDVAVVPGVEPVFDEHGHGKRIGAARILTKPTADVWQWDPACCRAPRRFRVDHTSGTIASQQISQYSRHVSHR